MIWLYIVSLQIWLIPLWKLEKSVHIYNMEILGIWVIMSCIISYFDNSIWGRCWYDFNLNVKGRNNGEVQWHDQVLTLKELQNQNWNSGLTSELQFSLGCRASLSLVVHGFLSFFSNVCFHLHERQSDGEGGRRQDWREPGHRGSEGKRERKREWARSSIPQFTLQMPSKTRDCPGWNRRLELHLGPPHGWPDPKHLSCHSSGMHSLEG